MISLNKMMNITPQELGSYIAQNHGNHSVTTAEYLYSSHSAPATVHHPSQSVGSVGCPSSQQSSDDDLSFYNNPVTHPVTTSLSHSLGGGYSGSENGDITTSLYGLVNVTPAPTLTTVVNSNPSPFVSYHLHPHTAATTITSPSHSHHNGSRGSTTSSSSHQRPSSRASSSHSHQSYTAHSQMSGLSGPRSITDVRMDSSPYRHHSNHHHKNYHHHNHHRKRKSPIPMVESEPDDDSETCSSRLTTTPTDEGSKKQNHSEIEKRRRDKMNTYITELSGMVPMCNAMSRKLDKLTVLRMAVQHMKTLRGSRIHSYTEGHYKPSFLTDEELKHLILQSAEGFLFVVGCDRGRLLYISESVSQVLNFTQSDLLGQSWFDILHPKDVAKVKEQLSSPDLAPRERLIDAKTMLPVKGNVPQKANRLCPGARRSFFCRMKCKSTPHIKEEAETSSSGCHRRKKASNCERKFCVIHCTGYLKSWAKVGMEDCEGEGEDPCNLSCLVAVGRILKPIIEPSSDSQHRPVTFISRHAIDGKFVFVDQRTTLVVGFLPQELLGTSMYEYFHPDDITSLADVHKAVLVSNDSMNTQLYRFRTRNGDYAKLQSNWKAFRNPWTKDIEYIIAKNTLSPENNRPWSFEMSKELMDMDVDECADDRFNRSEMGVDDASIVQAIISPNPSEFEFFSGHGNGNNGMGTGDIQRLINSEVPFRKIGEQIAEDMVENQRRNDSSASNSPVSVLDSTALVTTSVPDTQLTAMLSSTSAHATTSAMLSSIPASQQITQVSKSNQAAVPQRQSTIQTNACSPNDGSASSGASQSEGAAEGLVLSSRTNDPVIGATAAAAHVPTDEEMLYMIGGPVLPESPHHATSGDGNDEAAMAVIMSLLEADAGLGGPVDFSGLPWPI